jgi:hypothetical protein
MKQYGDFCLTVNQPDDGANLNLGLSSG